MAQQFIRIDADAIERAASTALNRIARTAQSIRRRIRTRRGGS